MLLLLSTRYRIVILTCRFYSVKRWRAKNCNTHVHTNTRHIHSIGSKWSEKEKTRHYVYCQFNRPWLSISFFSSWRFFLSFFLFIPFSFLSRFLFLSSSLTIFSFFFSWATFLPSLGFGARTRSLFQIMNERSFSAFLYRWLLYYYYAFCCEGGPFFTIVFDFFSLSPVLHFRSAWQPTFILDTLLLQKDGRAKKNRDRPVASLGSSLGDVLWTFPPVRVHSFGCASVAPTDLAIVSSSLYRSDNTKNHYKTKYLQWKIMNQEQKQIMRMIRKHKRMNKFKPIECCLQFWREKVLSVKTCKPITI